MYSTKKNYQFNYYHSPETVKFLGVMLQTDEFEPHYGQMANVFYSKKTGRVYLSDKQAFEYISEVASSMPRNDGYAYLAVAAFALMCAGTNIQSFSILLIWELLFVSVFGLSVSKFWDKISKNSDTNIATNPHITNK